MAVVLQRQAIMIQTVSKSLELQQLQMIDEVIKSFVRTQMRDTPQVLCIDKRSMLGLSKSCDLTNTIIDRVANFFFFAKFKKQFRPSGTLTRNVLISQVKFFMSVAVVTQHKAPTILQVWKCWRFFRFSIFSQPRQRF